MSLVKPVFAALVACTLTSTAFPLPIRSDDAAVKSLVERFWRAEKAYDAVTLSSLIKENYVEVSPAGEVDEHDRFLGFYAADKKAEWPPMTTSEEQVRVFGDTAIEVVKFTYQMPSPDGQVHVREIRGSFIAQKEHGIWKLLGAHYTGIRQVQSKS